MELASGSNTEQASASADRFDADHASTSGTEQASASPKRSNADRASAQQE